MVPETLLRRSPQLAVKIDKVISALSRKYLSIFVSTLESDVMKVDFGMLRKRLRALLSEKYGRLLRNAARAKTWDETRYHCCFDQRAGELPEITWQLREWREVHQPTRHKLQFHSLLHHAPKRTEKTTAPSSHENRRLGNALGFVGEEIIRRGQRRHGRRYSRGRLTPWVRRHKSLCCR